MIDGFFIFLSGGMIGFVIGLAFGPEIVQRWGRKRL